MRAWELLGEAADEVGVERYDDAPEHRPDQRIPTISLRHIHRLAQIQAAKRAEHADKAILRQLMYGVVDEDKPTPIQKKQDAIDLRMKELELKKLEQEIANAEREWEMDIHRMAASGIKKAKK